MPTFTPPRMHVVRKEEKEARLNAFIADQLALAAGHQTAARGLTVLARSLESPVLKALAAHVSAIRSAGFSIRAVVVLAEGASPDVTTFLDGVASRLGCDARLLDAHEQLAIGDDIAWIGDCMRREPTKRDAYEIYSAGCAETAAVAHRSFDRVWTFAGMGSPEGTAHVEAAAPATPGVTLPVATPLPEGETAPVVSTRH